MPPAVDRVPIPRPRLTTASRWSPSLRLRLAPEDMIMPGTSSSRFDPERPTGERAAIPGKGAAREGVALKVSRSGHRKRYVLIDRREGVSAHQAEELLVQADDLRYPWLTILLALFH